MIQSQSERTKLSLLKGSLSKLELLIDLGARTNIKANLNLSPNHKTLQARGKGMPLKATKSSVRGVSLVGFAGSVCKWTINSKMQKMVLSMTKDPTSREGADLTSTD